MEMCDTCNKQFSSPRSFKRHNKEIHGHSKHGCGTCGKTFRRSDALKIHSVTGKCKPPTALSLTRNQINSQHMMISPTRQVGVGVRPCHVVPGKISKEDKTHSTTYTDHENTAAVRLKFIQPSTFLICGPTSCGKSTWVFNLLKNLRSMFEPVPKRIVYCYGEYQSGYDDLKEHIPHIEFVNGLVDVSTFSPDIENLLCIDDLMAEAGSSQEIANMYTRGSHHRNLSVLLLAQNLFANGKFARTISLNSHYIVLFKAPRDASQITTLAAQMYPGKTHVLRSAYDDATKEAHGYLLLDLKQNTSDQLRLRTSVLPNERPMIVYVPEK